MEVFGVLIVRHGDAENPRISREREREGRQEGEGKIRFYEREGLPWTFESGWNSPSVNMFEKKKKERRKKKSYFIKESMALILFI